MKVCLGFNWTLVMALGVACSSTPPAAQQAPACNAGEMACKCYPNDTCNPGLTCFGGLCLDSSLAVGGASGFGGSAGDMSVAGGGGSGVSAGGASGDAGGGASGSAGDGAAGTAAGGASGTGSGAASGNGGASGSGAQGGMSGSGGTGGADPNVVGCALVTSCTGCCDTTGVFALDAAANDRTTAYVTDFKIATGTASAAFSFPGTDDVGAIFFHFNSPQNIGSLGITGSGTGGSLEIALVRSNGADGCIYPVVGGTLSSTPNACWGLGAGPYAVLPADQIEVRVRSLYPGTAALNVSNVQFGP